MSKPRYDPITANSLTALNRWGWIWVCQTSHRIYHGRIGPGDQAPNVQLLLCTLLLLSLGTGLGLWSLGAENQQKTRVTESCREKLKNEPMPIAISSQHQVFFKRIVSIFSESSFHMFSSEPNPHHMFAVVPLVTNFCILSIGINTALKHIYRIYIVTSQQNIADPMKAQGFLQLPFRFSVKKVPHKTIYGISLPQKWA